MISQKPRRRHLLALGLSCGIGLSALANPGLAATDVTLVSGAFRRSIAVDDIEHLAETGEARGLLGQLVDLSASEVDVAQDASHRGADVQVLVAGVQGEEAGLSLDRERSGDGEGLDVDLVNRAPELVRDPDEIGRAHV